MTEHLAQPKFTMLLIGSFAAAALFLAAIGLYAVIAFGVTQRTAGNRSSRRARRPRTVTCSDWSCVAVRCLLESDSRSESASFALGRLVAGLLYGVAPADPPTAASPWRYS